MPTKRNLALAAASFAWAGLSVPVVASFYLSMAGSIGSPLARGAVSAGLATSGPVPWEVLAASALLSGLGLYGVHLASSGASRPVSPALRRVFGWRAHAEERFDRLEAFLASRRD